jgi:hypothetical protein
MNWPSDLAPLLLLTSGIALLFWSRRRRFDRLNKYGVERFPSFRAKLTGRIGDHAVMGSAMILLAAGTITLAANHLDSWGWIVMLPLVVAMLYLLLGI